MKALRQRVVGSARTWAGATVAAVWVVAVPAFAYHDTRRTGGGGAPLDFIVLIAGAVALGLIALAVWGRRSRKTRLKGGKRKQRSRSLDKKRR